MEGRRGNSHHEQQQQQHGDSARSQEGTDHRYHCKSDQGALYLLGNPAFVYLNLDHAFQDITDILTQLKTEIKATEELIRVGLVLIFIGQDYTLISSLFFSLLVPLQETKIGLTVGKLRTHENKEVSSLAKELVKKVSEHILHIRQSSPDSVAPCCVPLPVS